MTATDVIRFACPYCRKPLRVKGYLAGRPVNCPNRDCAMHLLVPDPAVADPEPAGPEYDPPDGTDEALGGMKEAVWGKWHWPLSLLVSAFAGVLWWAGYLEGINFGLVTFFGVVAVFATRFVFSPDATLAGPRVASLIGTKNPALARVCLILGALFGWLAVVAALCAPLMDK